MAVPYGLIRGFASHFPVIADDAFIAESAAIIGNVEIGSAASVWYGCVLRGDIHSIRVGARTNIQDGTVVHVNGAASGHDGQPVEIGDDVTIGHCCLIHACTIQDGGFVGMSGRVLDGAVIRAGGMLGAGGLLAPGKIIGSGELWLGVPARFARHLTEADRCAFFDIAERYRKLADCYRAEAGLVKGVASGDGGR